MAQMIPSIVPETVESGAEKLLFPILRDSLPDDFIVFHSFNLLTRNLKGLFVDGEIDFLVFSPKYSFLVLEVKGGLVQYINGQWYQNEHVLQDPFVQARASKFKLQSFLQEKLGRLPKAGFGHAVCFPEHSSEIKDYPPGADPEICITGKDLDNIKAKIISIMNSFGAAENEPLSEAESERIRLILMPQCEFGTSLKDRIDREERTMFSLTAEQCRLLDSLGRFHRLLIEGCAGSGKTILAVKKARQLAAEGKSVLLLSFNIMIGEKLSDEVKDLNNIIACNYHKFCIDILEKAGRLPTIQEDDAGFWDIELPEAFAAFCKESPIKFDAVIVDEGQDFKSEWWITIEDMVKPDGYFYIFYDPGQNLWKTKMDFPIVGTPITLSYNCRNTREIFNALKPHAPDQMNIMDTAPDGEKVIEFTSPVVRQRRRELGRILHDLVNNHGIEPERIVVLGGHSMVNTSIGTNPDVGNFTLSEKLESGPGIVQYHTYMKFKGCESDVVIMLDVDPNDDRWATLEALYTTISRARHLLYIIYKKGETHAE